MLLGAQARPIVADGDPQPRLICAANLGTVNVNMDGVLASGQRVVENVAEDLLQPEMHDIAARIRLQALREFHLPSLTLEGEVLPGLPPDARQVPMFPLQLDGGRVAPNLLV